MCPDPIYLCVYVCGHVCVCVCEPNEPMFVCVDVYVPYVCVCACVCVMIGEG